MILGLILTLMMNMNYVSKYSCNSLLHSSCLHKNPSGMRILCTSTYNPMCTMLSGSNPFNDTMIKAGK